MPRPPSAALTAAVACLGGALAAGCGQATQDAGERSGQHTLEVLAARFPSSQAVARPQTFELEVRNPQGAAVPNLVVSVDSFYYRSEYPNLSDAARPIWIVDEGPGVAPRSPVATVPFDAPGGDVTATSDVWATGPLAVGETRTLRWRLTPVRKGTHTVRYAIAAGLGGKATATLADGQPASGTFTVHVAPAPPVTHVNPETGVVEAGRVPVAPGP